MKTSKKTSPDKPRSTRGEDKKCPCDTEKHGCTGSSGFGTSHGCGVTHAYSDEEKSGHENRHEHKVYKP
jgi:hypothetical protein